VLEEVGVGALVTVLDVRQGEEGLLGVEDVLGDAGEAQGTKAASRISLDRPYSRRGSSISRIQGNWNGSRIPRPSGS
jgi:hypothetical protein